MSSGSGTRRGRKGHGEEEHENHERWLISYADMITLLMIFFIIMYSISSLQEEKFKAFQDSYKISFGALEEPPKNVAPDPKQSLGPQADLIEPEDAAEAIAKQVEQVKQQIKEQLEKELTKAGIADQVKVSVDSRGVVLVMTDQVLFLSGDATVLTKGRVLLKQLSPLLDNKDRPILVEGHTDSTPISTSRYTDNWDLSGDRAANVLRFLMSTGIKDDKLTIAGYADTRPKKSNQTAEGRAVNRRVELIIVVQPDDKTLAQAASAAGASLVPSDGSTAAPAPDATAAPDSVPAP